MRISIIGPALPIPPKGWGAVESLIWDMKLSLNKLGHEVKIINVDDPYQIISMINEFRPNFVHINYDDWVEIYPYIQYPCAVTTHFAYIERPELMGAYRQRVFDLFSQIKPNVFGLSDNINQVYHNLASIPKNKLFLNPNGVNKNSFRVSSNPKYPDHSIYLAKVDHRKRQFLFQQIDSLYYAGNIVEQRFDQSKNYLGEWEKDYLYLSRKFITVIPENKILDLEYVENKIIDNRKYSANNRQEILDYAKEFEWCRILKKYYLPNIQKVING